MWIVKKACLSVLLLLTSALAAYSQVKGTVVDPRGAVVSDARVILICDRISRSATTNAEGVFEFPVNIQSDGCYLSVSRAGFQRYQEVLPRGANVRVIRLDLAAMAETIDVIAENRELLPLLGTTLTTLDLSGDQLKRLSNNTAELLRYAKLIAGASGTEVVRVNGLPAADLPPAEQVGRIVINANPFSSEFTDGDRTAIDIFTLEPDRKFRMSFGGNSLGVGGGSGLSTASRADSSAFNAGVSGAVPYLPITFSANATVSRNATELPILPTSSTSQYSARSRATAFTVHHSDGAHFRMHLSHTQSATESRNVGVGGLTLAEAGLGSTFGARATTLAIHSKRERFLYRSGWSFMQTDSRLQANSATPGITILGTATSGGAALSKSTLRQTNWLATHVFESNSARPRWSTGVTISRADEHSLEEPNRAGVLNFANVDEYQAALSGKSTATWFVTRGNGNVRHASLMLAPFAQKLLLNSRRLVLAGGVRIDHQSRFSPLPSPRISAATQWRDFVFRLGAGQFVQTVPQNVFVRSALRDNGHLKDYVASGVSFSDVEKGDAVEMSSIQMRLSPDLGASRQLMTKSSIERSFGQLHSGIEYTWARDTHLLGIRRVAQSDDRWDIIESNRSAKRHQIHTRALYKWKSQTVMGHYEWIRSEDDAAGLYTHPAHQDNLGQEWARSAGVSPQNITVAGILALPAAVSVTLIQVWKGSSPYNITTGSHTTDGVYSDRGGRQRNSGDGPRYNSLSLMAHKRIRLRGELHFDLGVHADNLLNVTNYMSVGSIVGSDTFGKPIAAFPRRSIRFWIRF
jgi:hypothetical protein